MLLFGRILGTGFFLGGLYIIGQNIFFTTRRLPYRYSDVAADFSVIIILLGLLLIIFLPRNLRFWGWIGVAIGVASIVASGFVVLEPTTLWQFFLSFALMTLGIKLMISGDIDI